MPATPEDLFRRLHELGIETTTHRHAPLFTVEESRALRGDLPGGHCKSLFLKDKRAQFWLVVMLEDRKADLKWLAKHLGAGRLSFGRAELLYEVLGVIPGAVTPFGLINDRQRQVNVVLDAAMMRHDILNYHPLTNEATTTIRAEDLRRFIADCGHPVTEVEFPEGKA